jgi:hypothetical protein
VLAFTQLKRPFAGQADIIMPLHRGGNFPQSIVATQQFDQWRMDQSFDRCCGPGMVYELGLYLAVHLGVTEIITAGVDFDGGEHFYSNQHAIRRLLNRPQLHGKAKELKYMIQGIPAWRDWLGSQQITWRFFDAGQQTPLRAHLSPFVF